MTRVEVSRHVVADPASVALLLAEPASDHEPDHGWVVTSPRRSGVGFTAAVELPAQLGRAAAGEIIVEPSTDAGCEIRMVVAVADRTALPGIRRAGSTFLDLLAARARARSLAA